MNKHQIRISLKKGLENDQFSYLGPPNEKIDHKPIIYGQNRGHETWFIFWSESYFSSCYFSLIEHFVYIIWNTEREWTYLINFLAHYRLCN